jgi:hypothetical protein
MGICGYRSKSKESLKIVNKVVRSGRADIISIHHNGPIQEAKLNELFAMHCKKVYDSEIKAQLNMNTGLYVEFDCMLPPCGETWSNGKNVTNRFNTGNFISSAFIRHPNNRNEYIPLKPVFEIMQGILKTMWLKYTVSFERLEYNTRYWEESNAVLVIHILQQ